MAALFLNGALRRRIDRRPMLRRTRWALEAAILGSFWQICSVLKPAAASAFGRACLRAIGPSLGKSAHVDRNLRVAFPDLDDAGRRALLREIWGNAGAVLAESPHFRTICHDDFEKHIARDDRFDVEAYCSGARHGIFVTAHLGNWEVAVAAAIHAGIPVTVVYAPSSNPYIDRMLRRRREKLGGRLVSREEGARPIVHELSEGRSIGLVIDARDDSGVPLPFFDRDKMTTLAPARLALRFKCDLIPTRVERLGHARFRVTAYPPVRPDPALGSEREQAIQMTREVHRLFEHWIRARPHEWLCIKRAWARDERSLAA